MLWYISVENAVFLVDGCECPGNCPLNDVLPNLLVKTNVVFVICYCLQKHYRVVISFTLFFGLLVWFGFISKLLASGVILITLCLFVN